jgi:hypothetical protein
VPVKHKCSECGKPLENPVAKTCGNICRKKRGRRIARQKKEAGRQNALPEHQKMLADVTRGIAPDVAHEVAKEEIRPVVREALTQDVLNSIGALVQLTPLAVAALATDLQSADDKIRQKATELLLRYTVGHQAVAPSQQNAPAPMQVQLMWPTAAPDGTIDAPRTLVEATEDDNLVECMECHEKKQPGQMYLGSERCTDCHEAVLAKVRARFPDEI